RHLEDPQDGPRVRVERQLQQRLGEGRAAGAAARGAQRGAGLRAPARWPAARTERGAVPRRGADGLPLRESGLGEEARGTARVNAGLQRARRGASSSTRMAPEPPSTSRAEAKASTAPVRA